MFDDDSGVRRTSLGLKTLDMKSKVAQLIKMEPETETLLFEKPVCQLSIILTEIS